MGSKDEGEQNWFNTRQLFLMVLSMKLRGKMFNKYEKKNLERSEPKLLLSIWK